MINNYLERQIKENFPYELTFEQNKTVELLYKIKPTSWDMAKTSDIDFSKPFLWFDDDLFSCEKQDLINSNAIDNWIEVNHSKDPDMLAKFINSFPIPF